MCTMFFSVTGLSRRAPRMPMEGEVLDQGDRVLVAGQRRGVVRFSGETDFAPGEVVGMIKCLITSEGNFITW